MEIAGYLATFLMGLVLGLLGSGGAILTVPILVYLFRLPPMIATSYSLGVVGTVSLAGLPTYWKRGCIDIKVALSFYIPSFLMILFFRRIVLPALPTTIPIIAPWSISLDTLTLLLFAILMVVAASSMLRQKPSTIPTHISESKKPSLFRLGWRAAGVGSVTGLIGAGGGFLIVPTLNAIPAFGISRAMGTSLLIVALNSLSGFLLDRTKTVGNFNFDLYFFLSLLVLPLAGMVLGAKLNARLPTEVLKKYFAYFVLFAGVLILIERL